jgi:hypothetical protein
MTLQTNVIDTRDAATLQASIQNLIDAGDPEAVFRELTFHSVRHALHDGFSNGKIPPEFMGTIIDALPPARHFEFFDDYLPLHFVPIAVINLVLEKTNFSADETFEVLSRRNRERFSVLSSVAENTPEFIQLLQSVWPIWTPEQRAEIAVRDHTIYNYVQVPLIKRIEGEAAEGERGDQFLIAILPFILEGLNLEDRMKGLQEATNASFMGARLNLLNMFEYRENPELSLKIYNLIGADNFEKLAWGQGMEKVATKYLNVPSQAAHTMTKQEFAKLLNAPPPASPTIAKAAAPSPAGQ